MNARTIPLPLDEKLPRAWWNTACCVSLGWFAHVYAPLWFFCSWFTVHFSIIAARACRPTFIEKCSICGDIGHQESAICTHPVKALPGWIGPMKYCKLEEVEWSNLIFSICLFHTAAHTVDIFIFLAICCDPKVLLFVSHSQFRLHAHICEINILCPFLQYFTLIYTEFAILLPIRSDWRGPFRALQNPFFFFVSTTPNSLVSSANMAISLLSPTPQF